jgi:hypothetical protein
MDVYSGLENPSWSLTEDEATQLQDRVLADPTVVSDIKATDGRLGYKGYIVSAYDEPVEGAEARLPSRFRVGGPVNPNPEVAAFLLKSTEKADTEVTDWLRDYAKREISRLAAEPRPMASLPQALGSGSVCGSNYLTSSSDFSFWNASQYVSRNNCYNFASNYRTNTYAQPGKKAGRPATALTGDAYASALHADGWSDSCLGGGNSTAALVIWPGHDFHFYRLCSGWLWCHKMGGSPARNTDNSGRLINSPQTCDRGPYTTFVGYIHAGSPYVVVA